MGKENRLMFKTKSADKFLLLPVVLNLFDGTPT